MAFMLTARWHILPGARAAFEENQRALCRVMLEHPGVICYHAAYPDAATSEWIEIYANDAAFQAHLDNPKGKAPLAAVTAACSSVDCRCYGDPGPGPRAFLESIGASFHPTAAEAFVLNPRADRDSRV